MKLLLSRRITIAFTLLSAVVCGIFAVVVHFAIESLEDTVFPGRMAADLALVADLSDRGQKVTLPQGRRHWVAPDIPAAFATLPPGFHSVETPAQSNFVTIADINGRRHWLAYEESDFERLEAWLNIALVLGCVAALGAAVWLASLTTSRVISPLRDLAQAVREDRPPAQLPLLQAEDELGDLARAFAARTEALQQFLTRERLFTADASHELRTPLTVVLGAAEVLKIRASQAGDADAVRAAERVLRAAREASALVSAFLLLSRSPDPAGVPAVALRPLVEREIERQRVWLGDKQVALELKIEAEPRVHAAPELLTIAVGNLVRNACQYTTDGAITVTLTADRLEVADTGPGVPPVVRERLFERQTAADRREIQGNGIGLSIVQRVVDHLGWRIAHASVPSGGSLFTLHFSAS